MTETFSEIVSATSSFSVDDSQVTTNNMLAAKRRTHATAEADKFRMETSWKYWVNKSIDAVFVSIWLLSGFLRRLKKGSMYGSGVVGVFDTGAGDT